MNDLELYCERAVLVLVDAQTRMAGAMPEKPLRRVLANVEILLRAMQVLEIPLLATEQYPRGLGPTLESLSALVPNWDPVAKTTFSCLGADEFRRRLEALSRRQVLLCGMESHVCIYQTARDLCRRGYQAFILRDAVTSRTKDNWLTGLSLCERTGAVLSSTETALFDLMKEAGSDKFRAVSKLVK